MACKHCYHQIKRIWMNDGGIEITKRCCHCGDTQVEVTPPMRSKAYTYNRKDHGPYQPGGIYD